MPRTRSIDKVLSDAEQIARVWGENPTFKLSDTTFEQFQTLLTELRTERNDVENKRTQLTAAINAMHDKAATVGDRVTRARSGFRSFFGPNSTQYEQAGGTPNRERKRPTRRTNSSNSDA